MLVHARPVERLIYLVVRKVVVWLICLIEEVLLSEVGTGQGLGSKGFEESEAE